MATAKIPDTQTLIQAGFFRRDEEKCCLKKDIKRMLRIIDEQDAINRFKWGNLPSGLTGQLLERILYYKAQGMFFYMDNIKKFLFLPYGLEGSIDVYGRWNQVTPLPWRGAAQATNEKGDKEKPWIVGLTRNVEYEVLQEDQLTPDKIKNSCVLLSDYSNQLSETNISRQIINDSLLDVEAECFPFMRTALINSTGINGMRVNDADQESSVLIASNSVTDAALTGKKWIPVTGQIEFQDLASGEVGKSEEFLLAMQSLDNFRLASYGLENGGLFQKKAHELESEHQMNSNNIGRILQDGLTLRQRFCDIVNSIWGLGIYVETSETVLDYDANMDGEIADNFDQSGANPGQQDVMSTEGGTDEQSNK